MAEGVAGKRAHILSGRQSNEIVRAQAGAIISSELFDFEYYWSQSGVEARAGKLATVEHYLTVGEPSGLCPMRDFEPAYYRKINPDVAADGVSPFYHYVTTGKGEGRLACKADAAEALELIAKYEPHAPIQHKIGEREDMLSADERLLVGGLALRRVFPRFDPSTYLRYPDVPRHEVAALVQWLQVGVRNGRVCNPSDLETLRENIRDAFDPAYYSKQLAGPVAADLLDDWIFHGSVTGLDPSPEFSTKFYKTYYSDMQCSADNAFNHFALNGRAEGRIGNVSLESLIKYGGLPYEPNKKTLVICIHEASETGAPILGLELMKYFSAEFNITLLLPRGGSLLDELVMSCVDYVIGHDWDKVWTLERLKESKDVFAVLMNSVETYTASVECLQLGIPTVLLMHEFAIYSIPKYKTSLAIEYADVVVLPASVVKESVVAEFLDYAGVAPNNLEVRPQGYLPRKHVPETPSPKPSVSPLDQLRRLAGTADLGAFRWVVGAGYVQMRKGVDIFIQTAMEVKRLAPGTKFLWIGGGYVPEEDLGYSIWLRDMVIRSGLEGDVLFLGHQPEIDSILELADVFYLPSRLDPFPNVALDALALGKPLVCFDQATGIAEAIRNFNFVGGVADYCSVASAAKYISDLLASPVDLSVNKEIIREKFDFAAYGRDVRQFLDKAVVKRDERLGLIGAVASSAAFDAAYFIGADAVLPEVVDTQRTLYVNRSLKGLTSLNPMPGANIKSVVGASTEAAFPSQSRLASLLTDRASIASDHTVVDLNRVVVRPGQPVLRTAVHIHLHYTDLADEYFSILTDIGAPIDLFVSVTSRISQIEVQYAFRNYTQGDVNVVEVENRGRDIAPFLTTFAPALGSGAYDLIGHFHGKKTLDVGGNIGNRWRQFLSRTLLGQRQSFLKIQRLFLDSPSLGLVFAEDRHCVGWTKNRPFGDLLAGRLASHPRIVDFPVFPLGTMFWSRPGVFRSAWEAGSALLADAPAEPLPYDATILHAFERMVPAIAEAEGFEWLTVMRGKEGW